MDTVKKLAGKAWKWIKGAAGVVGGVLSPTKQTSYLWKIVLVIVAVVVVVLSLRCLTLAKARAADAEAGRLVALEEKGRVERDRDAIAADLEKHKLAYQNAASDLSVLELRALFSQAEIETLLIREPDGRTVKAIGVKISRHETDEKRTAASSAPILPVPLVKPSALSIPPVIVVQGGNRLPVSFGLGWGTHGFRGGVTYEFVGRIGKRAIYLRPGFSLDRNTWAGLVELQAGQKPKK